MENSYPKWIYSPTGEAKIVQTPGQHSKHDGWYESPGEAADAKWAVAVPTAAPAMPPPVSVPEAPALSPALQRYYDAPVKDIGVKVRTLDADGLEELRLIEEQRPGGGRKTVLRWIAERMARLKGEAAKEDGHGDDDTDDES